MIQTFTIVMYHYVRELSLSRFPEIKGLELSLFREQLGYVQRHYLPVTAQDLIAAVKENHKTGHWDLPNNAIFLTFDDGYADHYQNVFPLLDEAGIQGGFFPPAKAIAERKLLDVNKIHFILASVRNKLQIVDDILHALDKYRESYQLKTNEAYYERFHFASSRDSAEVVFIKNMLQVALPLQLREQITSELFMKYVSADETAFADALYMSMDQLRCIARHGMYVGSHSDNHVWLSDLAPAEQALEIDRSMKFLAEIGTDLDGWIMCYPYGKSNQSLLSILKARNCAVGLTTEAGLATSETDPLLFPRLDTNDLPKQTDAWPNVWTARVVMPSLDEPDAAAVSASYK